MLVRRLFGIVLLLLFVATGIAIDLCHTEDIGKGDPYCPACNFHGSCVAIAIVQMSLLPDLTPAEFLYSGELIEYSAQIIIAFPPRPPPCS